MVNAFGVGADVRARKLMLGDIVYQRVAYAGGYNERLRLCKAYDLHLVPHAQYRGYLLVGIHGSAVVVGVDASLGIKNAALPRELCNKLGGAGVGVKLKRLLYACKARAKRFVGELFLIVNDVGVGALEDPTVLGKAFGASRFLYRLHDADYRAVAGGVGLGHRAPVEEQGIAVFVCNERLAVAVVDLAAHGRYRLGVFGF